MEIVAETLALPLLYMLAEDEYRNLVTQLPKKRFPKRVWTRLFITTLISTSPPTLMEVFNGLSGSMAFAPVVPIALNTLVRRTTPFKLDVPRPIVASQRFTTSNVGVFASKITSPENIDYISCLKLVWYCNTKHGLILFVLLII